ncbi:hypothetical protein [Kitasatospora sp. NPDC090091]|uniref:hypothetical protein n=1 Tax=Kitasatospora sp. NPDC090091 TaxID=3364081 RepID=UPI0037F40192
MTSTLDPHHVLAHWLLTKPYGEETRGDYEREVTRWIQHTGPNIWSSTGRQVRDWVNAPDRPRTEAWRISVLRGFYQHAQELDRTIANPVPRGLRPAVDGLPAGRPALTRAESTLYISALDSYNGLMPERARALGYLVLGRGLRAHQAVALDITDIIREQHRTTARVTLKGGGTEIQELPPPVAFAVDSYLPHRRTAAPDSSPEAGPLLTSGRGRRLDSYNSPRELLRTVAAAYTPAPGVFPLAHLAHTLTADGLAASPNPFLG